MFVNPYFSRQLIYLKNYSCGVISTCLINTRSYLMLTFKPELLNPPF